MLLSTASDSSEQSRQQSDWRLLGALWPYARRHWSYLVWSLVFLPLLAFADAVQPLILQRAIDGPIAQALAEGQLAISGLTIYIVWLLLTVVARLVFQGLEGYTSQTLGQLMTRDIRSDLFAHILRLPARFFDRTPVGRLITRITSDVEALGDVFSTGTIGIVSDLFTLLVIGVVMISQRWDLGLLMVGLVIPMAVLVIGLQRRYRDANFRVREELSRLNSWLQENILGVNVVQLFRRERLNGEIFRDINRRYIQEVDATIFYDSVLSAILEWVAWLAVAALLWVGGQQILQASLPNWVAQTSGSLPLPGNGDPLTFGSLYAFILFSQRFFNPLRQLAEKFTSLQAGFTAVERITSILNLTPDIQDPPQPRTLPSQGGGEIAFEHVWFGYSEGEWVLKDLNFTVRPGEKIALVGPTGAGKSSIIRLLCRLYEVSRGRILIDGVDIRDLTQAELHRQVGVILQDGFLFAGDIVDNITLGETGELAAVQHTAQQLNLDPFIQDLPKGYQTSVRERGNNLSSGQKQLISFVRAMWRNPRILVLDEATASLDIGTEALLQEALDHLLDNRTALMIAHRLSTIRQVDRILVLQRGELKEQGSHSELMALNGLYASLYRLQDLGSPG
ncbi:MAG: ABC transporter ATP-binding protein [Cyanobacteriota bacterium]|nr:ABC transporter ATP-binding protein [Cyanobacteriota bacterium]